MIYQLTRNYSLAFVILCVLFSFTRTASAQDTKQADKHFNEFEFSLALEEYKAILDQGEPSLPVVQRIADIYRILNNSKEAEFWWDLASSIQ